MQTKEKNKVLELVKDYLLIVLGSVLYVISVKCFAAPMQIPSGGVDVIGKFMYKHFSVQMGTTSMTVNVGVLLLSAFGLGSLELLMYGIIMQYAVSNMTDVVVYGSDHQKKALIVTKKPQEVSHMLMEQIGHGVTALEGQGMYTGEERLVLLCVIRPHETNLVKKKVLEIDDTAFIMLSDVNEVLGRGFKQLRAE